MISLFQELFIEVILSITEKKLIIKLTVLIILIIFEILIFISEEYKHCPTSFMVGSEV